MIKTVSEVCAVDPRIKIEAEKFMELVRKSKRILISSTLTSDGDSIGAQLGLLDFIRRVSSQVEVFIVDQSPVPSRYKFLKETERIQSMEEFQRSSVRPAFDLGVVCDGGIERTGNVQELFTGFPSVLVDHHAVGSRLPYASTILDAESSSSCELVYQLFEVAGFPVSLEVAEALYVGIVFDTGFFKHSLTRPKTHLVAAKLIETGIDFSKISDRAILERTWRAQLLLKVLLNHMKMTADGKIISSYWSLDDFKEIGPEDGDQEGMINQLYFTQGAEVVALFVENDGDEVKISFRSKGHVNVAEFARKLNPNGGGHIRAAGCTVKGSLASVQKDVLEKLTAEISR